MAWMLAVAFYGMPFFGFGFVLALLKAVEKIVKRQSYTAETVCAGVLFAVIVWTIAAGAMTTS